MDVDRPRGKSARLTTRHLTILRIDGGIPYETIEAMSEEELLTEWEEYASLVRDRNEQQEQRMATMRARARK